VGKDSSVLLHLARKAFAPGKKPCVLWLTGFSGSGKSTIANLLEKKLAEHGKHTYLLDGDNVVNVSENTPWYKGEL
jgi:adenylylsulfate kinase-like enzyme